MSDRVLLRQARHSGATPIAAQVQPAGSPNSRYTFVLEQRNAMSSNAQKLTDWADKTTNGSGAYHGSQLRARYGGGAGAETGKSEGMRGMTPVLTHKLRHNKSILALAVSSNTLFAGTEGGEILV